MKIAKPTSVRLSTKPEHQIQFDEEMESSSLDQEKPVDWKKRYSSFVVYWVLCAWFVFTLTVVLIYSAYYY